MVRTLVTATQHGGTHTSTVVQKVTYRALLHGPLKPRTSSLRASAFLGKQPVKDHATRTRPHDSGPVGVIVNAQGFGSTAVGGAPVVMTLTYAAPASGVLTAAVTQGIDFGTQTPSCSAGQCMVSVTFTPLYPGLLRDALTLTDGNGNVVYSTFLYGTGTAPQFGYDLGDLTVYSNYSPAPYSITVGPDLNVYYTDRTQNVVYKCAPGLNSCSSVPVSGLGQPAGVAVDGNSTVYVVDQANNQILTYSVATGSQGVLTTSTLSVPTGVAVDGTGAVYIADTGNGRILEEDNQGNETVLVTGLNSPNSLALDSTGDLFFADAGSAGEIQELPAGSTTPVSIETSLGTLNDIAVDAAGRIYASTPNGDTLISPNQSTVGYGGGSNYGMWVDQLGNIYTTQPTGGGIAITNRSMSNFILNAVVDTTSQGGDTISNTGNLPLALTTLAIAGTPFTLDASSQCQSGQSLVPGQVCSFTVDFSPTATGSYQATVTGTTNSLNAAGSTNQDTVYGYGTGFATSTTLSAPASVSAGQPTTLTATVGPTADGQPSPTGSVQFLDGTTALGTGMLDPGTGMATYQTSSLAAGQHSITATYGGDSLYGTSTSAAQIVTVTASTTPTPPPTPTIATTTGLVIGPAGVAYRTPATLTASVQTATGTPVTTGQVIFCLSTATHCTLELNLAIAQLTPLGTAVARLSPGTIGSHSYEAVFAGTATFVPSASATASVTVTGVYPTASQISSTGSPGSYDLTGTVVGTGTRTLGPTGTVSFQDTTANTILGSAPLGAPVLSFSEVAAAGSPAGVGSEPYGVAAGDLNGDGFADVVVENYESASVSVLLGNGDGTFQPQVTYAVGDLPERVLITDVNGDGFPDLVVANTGGSSISILLGNGDGTFQTQTTYAASSPVGLGVLDLNHDGIVDLVASDYYSNSVSVLLGNGDGTFQAAVTYATGGTPQTLAEGDFNGDGNVDLVVGNLNGNTVGIFLGNGDGTFQTMVTYPVGSQPQGVQVGDFNGDGIDDVAVSNNGSANVSILLGNGDGSFQPQMTYPVGQGPVGIVLGDFNGDGIQDISTNNANDQTQSVLLGNGDGTFAVATSYPAGNFPYGVAAADFNGDGLPDLAISNFNDGTATILLSQIAQTASASLTGVNLTGTAGTHQVDASYPSDTNFAASVSAAIPLTSEGGAPTSTTTTSLTISPASQTAGKPVTFTVSVTATTDGAATPSGTVTLTNTATTPASALGSITLGEGGFGSFSTGSLPPGTYSVVASYPGSGTDGASASTAQPLTIAPAPTMTVLSPSSASLSAGQTETLTASVTGGISPPETGSVVFTDQNGMLGSAAVTATGTGGVASLVLTTLSVGTHLITARYSGDTNYAPSQSATQTVVVSQTAQTINFPPIPNQTVGAAPFALNATATSGLAVSYSVLSGPATVSGNTVNVTGAGVVTIQATQTGNASYAAATPVSQSFTVTVATVSLSGVTPASGVVGSGATTVMLNGTGFSASDVAQLNGTAIPTTFVSASALSAVLPASFLSTAGTGQLTVFDPPGSTTTTAVTFTVTAAPQIVFSGPDSAVSGQQPTLTFQLVNPYPIPLAGALTLTFAPATTSGINDPNVQFSSGGRSIDFAIPANSTATPTVQLQTGTIAGVATVALTVTANGVDVTPTDVAPVVITIPAAVPSLTLASPSLTRDGQTLTIRLAGFSNTREATKAMFHFDAVPGTTFSTSDIPVDVTSDFAQWYGMAESDTYGSEFTYTQSFTLSVDASFVQSVTVTLVNTVGASTPVTLQ